MEDCIMWENFTDLDRTFAALDHLMRFGVNAARTQETNATDTFRFAARDDGDAYVLRAELPGVPAENVELTLLGQVLKLRATRKLNVPEGFTAHRRERADFDVTRSITLPVRVDAERVTAEQKDGVLVVRLPKAAESKPRTINVKALTA
jgi:HSP20 family protein